MRSLLPPGGSVDENSQMWLTQMFDYLPTPFFLVDFKQNRIVLTNGAARRMMGMDYEDNHASKTYLRKFSLYDPQGKLVDNNLPS